MVTVNETCEVSPLELRMVFQNIHLTAFTLFSHSLDLMGSWVLGFEARVVLITGDGLG